MTFSEHPQTSDLSDSQSQRCWRLNSSSFPFDGLWVYALWPHLVGLFQSLTPLWEKYKKMLHIPKNLQFFKDPIFSSLSGCLSKLSCFVRCLKSLTSDGYRFPAPGNTSDPRARNISWAPSSSSRHRRATSWRANSIVCPGPTGYTFFRNQQDFVKILPKEWWIAIHYNMYIYN